MEGVLAIIMVSLFSLWIWGLKQEVADLHRKLAGAAGHGNTRGPSGTGGAHRQKAAPARATSSASSLRFATYGDDRVWVLKS